MIERSLSRIDSKGQLFMLASNEYIPVQGYEYDERLDIALRTWGKGKNLLHYESIDILIKPLKANPC